MSLQTHRYLALHSLRLASRMTRLTRAAVVRSNEQELTLTPQQFIQNRLRAQERYISHNSRSEQITTERQVRAQHSRLQSDAETHPPSTPRYPPHILSSLKLLQLDPNFNTHIIPPAHGHAFHLPKGKSFRLIDLHGAQVIDLMVWTRPGNSSGQHSSMSYTRYNVGGSAPPIVGECIYTNLGQKMLKLTADTVRCHDMLFMACNPSFYEEIGLKGHRNCAENISGAVTDLLEKGEGKAAESGDSVQESTKRRIGWNEVIDPFNVFQNTPYYTLKGLGCSKPGDYCEWENVLGQDLVVGLSCCPFDQNGFNGGKVTEVAVVTERS